MFKTVVCDKVRGTLMMKQENEQTKTRERILTVACEVFALQGFRDSQGWEAGLDGNVALVAVGAGERVDTRTIKDPIVGFVFDVKGLMADISFKGAKFTKLDR